MQGIQPGAVGAALRIGVIGGVIGGALSLADPIFGGTLSRAGTDFSAAGAGAIAHDVQVALFLGGMLIYIVAGTLAARRGRSFALGLLAGVIAGMLGAVLGAVINIGASYAATDAEVNYLVALGGDVSLEMGQAGATGTAIFYGIAGVIFGTVQGVACGLIGAAIGRFLFVGGNAPATTAV